MNSTRSLIVIIGVCIVMFCFVAWVGTLEDKEENYQKDILEAGRMVRKGYMDYYET